MAPSPWEETEFLPSKPSTRNAYSTLNLLTDYLGEGEAARALLQGREALLLLTDRRLLELRPHLDDFGFWNVKSFEGYEVTLDLPLEATTLGPVREEADGIVVELTSPAGQGRLALAPHGPLTRAHVERFLALLAAAAKPL